MRSIILKSILCIMCLLSTLPFSGNVYAVEEYRQDVCVSQTTEFYGNGNYAIISVYQNSVVARSTTTGHKVLTYYDGGQPAWSLTVYGSFTFGNGSSKCTGSSVLYSIYDANWRKTSTRSTYSGNTATATGTFTKNNGQQDTCSVSVSCDAAGNIY